MKVGDVINGFSILWVDLETETHTDPLIKVGIKTIIEMDEHSYIYVSDFDSQITSYKNVHFKRKSELIK